MGRTSAERSTSLVVALGALLALLVTAPVAFAANEDGTARYEYQVTGFAYNASSDLDAGRDSGGCAPYSDGGWSGHIETAPADSDLAQLKFGEASLRIGNHGTSGKAEATLAVESSLDGFHTVISECNGLGGTESATETTVCPESGLETKLNLLLGINGGVGDRVKLTWKFSQSGGAGYLVPNLFSCVEPFEFADGSCKTKAKLNTFTSKKVTLPFGCLFTNIAPPPGRNYTTYRTLAFADGALNLKRTKQR